MTPVLTIESLDSAAESLRQKVFGPKHYIGFIEIVDAIIIVRIWNGPRYSKRYPRWRGYPVKWITGSRPRKFST